MKQLLKNSLLSVASLASLSEAAFAVEYREVVTATRTILSGRCFENEDRTRISFGHLTAITHARAEIDVQISFADGQLAHHREAINNQGGQVIVDQLIDGRVVGRYLASVEAPFNVLRLRPVNESSSNFISRECTLQSSDKKNVCFIKIRSEGDVFMSVFKEVPCS